MRESKKDIGFQNSNPNVRSLLGAPEMLNGLRGYKKALPKKCFWGRIAGSNHCFRGFPYRNQMLRRRQILQDQAYYEALRQLLHVLGG